MGVPAGVLSRSELYSMGMNDVNLVEVIATKEAIIQSIEESLAETFELSFRAATLELVVHTFASWR